MHRVRYYAPLIVLLPLLTISAQETVVERVYTIPSEATEDTSFYLARPNDMELLPSGHIAISDQGQDHIFIIDTDGYLVHTIGRNGRGPGEFDWITDITVDQVNGLLWAQDHRGLQAFSLIDYSYVDFVSLPRIGRDLVAAGGRLYLFPQSSRDNEIVIVYRRDGSLVETLGEHLERETQKEGLQLHTIGIGGVQIQNSDQARVLFIYTKYNDILLIEGNQQICLHLEDARIIRGHRERIVTTRQWDQRKNIIPSQMFASLFLDEEVFYLATQHNMGDRILEINYDGIIERNWVLPVERCDSHKIIVMDDGNKKRFFVLDRWAGAKVIVFEGQVSLPEY